MNRLKIAQYIATGATIFSGLGFLLIKVNFIDAGYIVILIGCLAAIISYLFAGLLTALKMVWKISRWGFIIAPLPYSLILFPVLALFSAMILLLLPIIPVTMVKRLI